jgi:AraC-like DNA-binding protein
MPIYMDIHYIPGVEAQNVAEAHLQDMQVQKEHQCKCMTYWVDESRGTVFCLIEAPDKSTVEEMHRHSHGLIPNKVIEVRTEVVESFLGRIHDPDEAEVSSVGLKVFSDPAFRTLLVTDMTDPVLLKHQLGVEKASALLNRLAVVTRQLLSLHTGREVEHPGKGFVASFASVKNALSCAMGILCELPEEDRSSIGLKMVLNGGEPVVRSDKLFGDTIRLARRLCTLSRTDKVVVSCVVGDLLARDRVGIGQDQTAMLTTQDEAFVETLFNKLEIHWQDPDFAVTNLCKAVSMSQSQLYRKTTALWDLAPNLMLRDFRLEKARELLKKQSYNVSQTTFDSGFSSPSYFTKCFKKKFGLLPAHYLHSLQA